MTDWITSGTWDIGDPEKHRLEAALKEARGERVLDIGCRDGTFALTLAREHPEIRVMAFDTDASAIAWAERKAIELGLENVIFWNLDLVTLKSTDGTLDGLTLGEHTFDTVYCMETFEHIPPQDFERAYEHARRFVRPGGRLVVTVPANSHISDPDHKQTFYREVIYQNHPDLIWMKECPHLWIGWVMEFPDAK